MKKLVLVSLALVIVCASLYASLPDKNRDGIVIGPLPIPIDDIDDISERLNYSPIKNREGIVIPPIYYADDNSVQLMSVPKKRREGIVIPPCPNDSTGNHKLMMANPDRRRGGIVIPPIHYDPFSNSKVKNTIELTNINGYAHVNMYDVTGKLVIETETSKYVDVSRVPSGKYIMIVTSGGNTVAGKVTVIK